MVKSIACIAFVATVAGLYCAEEPAAFLRQDAREALKKGDVVRAYLLYSQAAAVDPGDRTSWTRSLALRRRAIEAAKFAPSGTSTAEEPFEPDALSDEDLIEARRLGPPLRLEGQAGRRNFKLRGDARTICEQVLKAFGVEVVFDGDFQSSGTIRFELNDADFEEAVEALQAATGTFLIPVSERMAMVARDTQQKRQELEHNLAVAIPLPTPVTVQDAQELARSVQQLMEIQKLQIDNVRRIVLVRDRASKVIPAVALIEQMLRYRTEVMLEVEFLEMSEKASLNLGLQLPGRFPLVWLSRIWNSQTSIPEGVLSLLTFGGGKSFFGLGLADSQLFATMSRSSGRSLSKAELRSTEGNPVQFHLGDRYPVLSAGYFGATTGTGEAFTPPPTINFEDLGVVLKITPKVHSSDELTLEVEADYKVLTGEALNGIPVIANRKFQSTLRMRAGETAVVAGLMRSSEARTLTGIAGLGQLPVIGAAFRQNSREREDGQAIFTIRPRILSIPPAEFSTRTLWTGTESRARIPM